MLVSPCYSWGADSNAALGAKIGAAFRFLGSGICQDSLQSVCTTLQNLGKDNNAALGAKVGTVFERRATAASVKGEPLVQKLVQFQKVGLQGDGGIS